MGHRTLSGFSILFVTALWLSVGCKKESPFVPPFPPFPPSESYVMDYADFEYFEYARLISLFCIPDGAMRSMWITQDSPGEYSVGFRMVA
jgi:hypothetical protein